MSKVISPREAERPQALPERDAILNELHQVLASPHFCSSKRSPALLQYVVENTLAGRSDLLKERTLGVEVFDRPPAYDTNSDTVVRYTAGEVRKRLSLYYHEEGRNSRIRISLPAGSYVPEFVHVDDEVDQPDAIGSAHVTRSSDLTPLELEIPPALLPDGFAEVTDRHGQSEQSHRQWLRLWMLAGLLLIAIATLALWRITAGRSSTALDEFWAPISKDQKSVAICTGSVVFANNNFSGVTTAGKDIEYPFVSMQIASSISQLSMLLGRKGITVDLLSAASTPLTALREHPNVLLGGYNNQWTTRLLQPLRFHLAPSATPAIADSQSPQTQWTRDQSQPYSSADDYALVARFRDTTTDSWVVVLAGLGRNGTEAAAQFTASPHYMQLLKDQVGPSLSNKNLEVVLKVRVIDGKTGAPSIVAVHSW